MSYVEGSAELITGAAYNGTRNPLVAQFDFAGKTVTAIDVHFTSRLGSDPLCGAIPSRRPMPATPRAPRRRPA